MASGKSSVAEASVSIVEIQPGEGWTDPWVELAEELIASGRTDQAEEVIRHASRLHPSDGRVRSLRARLADQAG